MSSAPVVTQAYIKAAKAKGANRLPAVGTPFEDLDVADLAWALANFADALDDDEFALCAKKAPRTALIHARARLSAVQFAYCVTEAPGPAIVYARDHLDSTQFAYCIERSPWLALRHAASRMTPKQAAACERALRHY